MSVDLAPEEQRGTFLGVWQFLISLISIGIPLAIGSLAQTVGTNGAFLAIGVLLALAIPVMGLYGPDRKRAAATPVAAA